MTYNFEKKEHTLTITTGKYSCASEPGKFCRFFASRMMGCVPCCLLYGKDLNLSEEGVTLRCDECLKELK
jgi:hypothetical protein